MKRKAAEHQRGTRRKLRVLILIGCGVALLSLVWLADQARFRDGVFETRHGTLTSVSVAREEIGATSFTSESVRLVSDTGLAVEMRVLRPAAAMGTVPVVVILGGLRTGRDAVGLVGDPGPVAVIALDYPYQGPERPRGVRQSLASIPAVRRALLDTPGAVLLAMDWITAQTWVDTGRVELVGASLGGPFAAVAGALDPRFSRVWIIHAGADLRRWLTFNLRSRISSDWMRNATGGLLYLLGYGPTFESERWIRKISPRPVVIIGAQADERLPAEEVLGLYEAAGDPKELIWTEGGHVNPGEKEIVRGLLDIVRGRVMDEGAGR